MKLSRLGQHHAPVIATHSGLQKQAVYKEKLTRAARAEETGRKQRRST